MIKLIYCFRRRPGMSLEEFSNYWKNVHGPIGARIPGIRRAVQSHVLPNAHGIRDFSFDGMVELWFDDLESLQRARQTLEWRTSTEDETRFIDSDSTAFLIAEEHELELPPQAS